MNTSEILKNIKADFALAKRLTDNQEGNIVKQIRSMLPWVPCIRGCSACCEGVGAAGKRFFSRWEWAQIKDKRDFPEKGPCPYLVDGKCEIYDDRPLICRIYGTTLGTLLSCSRGRAPYNPLTLENYKAIERMRYVMMLRALPSRERKLAYKRIVKDLKRGGPSNQDVKSYMEMWNNGNNG